MTTDLLDLLRGVIDLREVPFTDRGSRMLLFREPDAARLHLRLCERWPALDYVEGSYRQRPSFLQAIELLDAEGAPLPFTASARPDRVTLTTPGGDVVVAFATPELLAFALPHGVRGLRFVAHADAAAADRRGGTTRGERHVAWTSNAPLRRNGAIRTGARRWRVEAVVDPGAAAMITLNVTAGRAFDRRVHPSAFLDGAAARWSAWLGATPRVRERDRLLALRAWRILGAGLVSPRDHLTRETMMPSKVHYVGTWAWDAYFHAIAYRHAAPDLAADQIRVLFDHQREDGFVPDAVFDEGVIDRLGWPVEGEVTKPPLAGWAAWKVHEASGDVDFLAEMYEPIARAWRWWHAHADPDGDGLCQYAHPFSSGADDSPLWDDGAPLVAPDLNTYLCVEAEALGRIADTLGAADAGDWRRAADAAASRMRETLYDEADGTFRALRPRPEGGFAVVRARTAFGLLPLWTGRMGPEVNRRLVAHLTDPRHFWTDHPVATVSRSDPAHDPNQMWRGPVWINVNYFFVEALSRAGEAARARQLCDATLDLVAGMPDIKEYYHPETGQAPLKAAPSFGWSAALALDLAVRRARGDI